MSIIFNFPNKIDNEYSGINNLIEIHNELQKHFFENIDLNFSNTGYIAANLSAVLGAILDDGIDTNSYEFVSLKPKVKKILQKNNFLSFYGYERLEDTYNTTIMYKKFKANHVQAFTEYLYDELFSKCDLPTMTKAFQKQLAGSLVEIFVNADMHGHCLYTYTCGQYFPNNHILNFTIVNLGKTMRENLIEFTNSDLTKISGINAINWAVKDHTTTKFITGGLGLANARKFIKSNKGKIQIISDDGFWQENVYGIICKEFTLRFLGTIVNFEINMDDEKNYYIEDEIENFEIF